MKKILTATALALVLSTSVIASPSQSDMNQVFGNLPIGEATKLSNNEMKSTEGARLKSRGFRDMEKMKQKNKVPKYSGRQIKGNSAALQGVINAVRSAMSRWKK